MAVIETKEIEQQGLLQTHYYKTSYEKLKDAYIEIIEKLGLRLISIDDNFNEIFADKGRMSVLAKIIEQNPRETSIDFYIDSESIFGAKKKAYALLDKIYSEIEKIYEIKGYGLHK